MSNKKVNSCIISNKMIDQNSTDSKPPDVLYRRNKVNYKLKSKFGFYVKSDAIKILEELFVVFFFFGLTLKETPKPSSFCSIRFWDNFHMVLHVVLCIFNLVTFSVLDMSSRLQCMLYAFYILCLLMRYTISSKKSKIISIFKGISSVSSNIKINNEKHLKYARFQVYLFIAVLFFLNTFASYFFSTLKIRDHIQWFDTSTYKFSVIIWCVRISFSFNMIISCAVLILISILCCNMYILSGNIVKFFDESFKENVNNFSKKTFLTYVSTYNHVVAEINNIDNAFSVNCFLIYLASVMSAFGAISTITYDRYENNAMMVLLQASFLIFPVTIFLTLTVSGSQIYSHYENLKITLNNGAEAVFAVTEDTQVMIAYKILLDIIFNTVPCFTGANMFKIRKSLILTICSALFTYGVIIFQ